MNDSKATNTEANALPSWANGFSLVEVVVSMVMLAVIVSSLAYFSTVTAQQAVVLSNATGREAFALQETNRIAALPYDSIPNKVGCDTVVAGSNGVLKYRRCLSYSTGTRYRDVTAIITPLKTGTYADTLTVRRVTSASSNPLNFP